MSKLPETRLRRLRRTESLRTLTGQPFPTLGKMIWPVFAVEGENQRIEIGSMPGTPDASGGRIPLASQDYTARF